MGVKERLTEEREKYGQQMKAEGRVEGRADALRAVVAKQLSLKFGPLPASTNWRLAVAEVDLLETWAARILTAGSLDEVWQG